MCSSYLTLSDKRVSQSPFTHRGVEKLKELTTKILAKKISEALEYTSEASIYNLEDTVSELTTAQTSVLVLFYGLLFGDLPLCHFIVQAQTPQLKSTFLRVWLADDFSFRNRDVTMVIAMLSFLLESKKVVIADHILRIFGGLVQKYHVADCCSKDLLAVFNEEQEKKGEQNQDEEKKSQNPNQDILITNAKEEKNSLTTSFRGMGSKRSWFRRNIGERAKNLDEEEFYVEDYEKKETKWYFDLDVSDNDENKQYSSDDNQGASAGQSEQKHVSETSKPKEHSGERKLQNYEVVDGKGRTLLHRLAEFGRTGAVRRLLEEGVNMDVTDPLGKTALHLAAENNYCSTVELLLKAGADVNARTFEGKTPLSYACNENGVVSDTWKIILKYKGRL